MSEQFVLAGIVATLAPASSLLWLRLGRTTTTGPTWSCGYAAPTPRMQYTASSFAQLLVGLFGWASRPRTQRPGALGLFPRKATFQSEVPDTVLDRAVLPAFRFGGLFLPWFRVFQIGSIQMYLLYIFLALFALLIWR
jgi:hydrogenase-4 component B